MNSLSSAQFSAAGSLGIDVDTSSTPSTPGALNTQSNTTAGKATAWTTRSLHGPNNTPLPMSKRTRGSYISWDDDGASPTMPSSDPGSNYALNR